MLQTQKDEFRLRKGRKGRTKIGRSKRQNRKKT